MERHTIIALLVAASMIMLTMSIVAWRKKSIGRSAVFLSICLTGVAVYCFGYGMELASNTLRPVMFWVRFQHWGIQVIAPTWLLFSLSVSGNDKRITPKLIILLSVIPVYLFLTSQTLGWLNLAHHNPQLDASGPFPLFVYDRNLFNYIAIGFYSFCLAVSTILFLMMLIRTAPSFRKQAAIYLMGSLPPWLGLVLHNLNLSASNLDYTPLVLGLGGLFFGFGFLKYRILDILPLARDTIFENIHTGILILNIEDRVIDFNPSLSSMIRELNQSAIGSPAKHLLANYPSLLALIEGNREQKIELEFRVDQSRANFRVNLSIMEDHYKRRLGKIISFVDFTTEKILVEKLEKLAATDGLTGIFNRQHFDQLAKREISRVQRYGGVLSLIMLDIDYFKQVNDTLGHGAGDCVLIAVAETLCNLLRKSDMLARYGGEEFVVLLPQTEPSSAYLLAERLCQTVAANAIHYRKHTIHVQASFGVVGTHGDETITLEAFYRFADQALYQAKQAGGNMVCVWNNEA